MAKRHWTVAAAIVAAISLTTCVFEEETSEPTDPIGWVDGEPMLNGYEPDGCPLDHRIPIEEDWLYDIGFDDLTDPMIDEVDVDGRDTLGLRPPVKGEPTKTDVPIQVHELDCNESELCYRERVVVTP